MGINKSPRRIKRDAGGRNKKPNKEQPVNLLYGGPKSPLYKPKVKPKDKPKVKPEVKPSEKTYIRFTRKKQLSEFYLFFLSQFL